MTVKSLDGYDIEELEKDYELEITKVDKGYLIECNAGVIETTDRLDNYIEWHDAADLFHSFDDEIEDWDDMSDREQEYHIELEKRMQEAEDKLF